MQTVPMGKIAVATAGTSVPITTSRIMCWKIRVQAMLGETGKVYLGDLTMAAGASHTGVIKEFWPTGAPGAVTDSFEFDCHDQGNMLDLSKFALDVQVNGEGALVTYWVK